MTDMEQVNRLTHAIIGCAIKVHRALGPGLLESTYKKCTAYELRHAGLDVDEERALPLVYGEVRLECGYRIDLVVNGQVIVEVKTVERLDPIHLAQMLTYLKLTGLPLGLLINFNTAVLKDGVRRVINTPQPVAATAVAEEQRSVRDPRESTARRRGAAPRNEREPVERSRM